MKKLLLSLALILSFITFSQPPAYVPTNGLSGWWPFNANANDESGHGNNGMVNEAWPATDLCGNMFRAYDFDGLALAGISVSASTLLAQNTRSYSLWVNINSTLINENSHLITSFDPCACDYLSINGNHPTYISNGTSGRFYDGKSGNLSTFAINDDTWHHIVVIHDYAAQTAYLYIDNVLNNTVTSTNFSVQTPLSDFVIGNGFSPQTALYGQIDDIAIWNRTLTDSEISALYHAQHPTVDLGADSLSVCGAATSLDAGSDPSWASYLWSIGNTTQTITAVSTGNYWVMVTDTNGCVGYDTTFIEAINQNTVASITPNACDTYTAPDGMIYTSSGNYVAVISNAAGCDSTVTLDVTINSSSTVPSISTMPGSYCPNTTLNLSASGGTSGTGSAIEWYTGPGGTGSWLGSGPSLNILTGTTTTYYARREGVCNITSDASVTVTIKNFVYAVDGSSTSTYCTDDFAWHHFFIGSDIIFSIRGDLNGAQPGYPIVTIGDNGNFYQENQGPNLPGDCIIGLSPGEQRFEMERNWNVDLDLGVSLPPYSVRFYYEPAERTVIENAATAFMATYPDCSYTYKYGNLLGFYWFKNTGSNYTAPDYDGLHMAGTNGLTANGVNYSELIGITSFSGGSGAITLLPSSLLPILLSEFNGINQGSINAVSWITNSELNNDYFTLERSIDGEKWEVVGIQNGAGNSQKPLYYSMNDYKLYLPLTYYRLKQTDFNGEFTYSEIISVNADRVDGINLISELFPNPANTYATFVYNGTNSEMPLTVEIINELGTVVMRNKYTGPYKGMANVLRTSNLASGVYTVLSSQGGNHFIQRLAITR